jgi:N-acyl-D-aspartate/D-glutamate deacylase
VGFDLVIRDAMVVDGSGGPPRRADVGIAGGIITAVGDVEIRGQTEISAEGRVVTPGFVDGHTHMDAQVLWDELGTSSCWHGVTTVVMGNCGFTLAPARPDEHELVVRNLERAEDISAVALAAGLPWSWETFPQYLDVVDAQPKGINYAAYVGHSALRTYVMGAAAFDGPAGDDDVEAMERELRQALRAGAIGFTTSLSDAHLTSDDRPVASRLTSWDELERLVRVMADERAGIFELAMETETRDPDPDVRAAALARLEELAVRTRVPTTFGVFGAQPTSREALALIDRTASRGGRMFGQSHSRGITSVQSFEASLAFDVVPEWATFRRLPAAEQLARLQDPSVRAHLVRAAHEGPYGQGVGTEARAPNYEELRRFDSTVLPNPSVAEIGRERGCDPVEVVLDAAIDTELRQLFVAPISRQTPDQLLDVMRHPRAVMTFSDSGAHVSQISDASLQTYFLAYWVRERQAFTFEQAIRMITWEPAAAWGLRGRGLVRPGWIADLNVVDPERLEPLLPVVERDLPGGAVRFEQRSQGIDATIVAGQVVIEHGEPTGALPGRLVRGPLADSPGPGLH